MVSAYGRLAAMRSCVLRILEAATISIALVIFCVFFTLPILVRISFAPAISFSSKPCGLPFQTSRQTLPGLGCFKRFEEAFQLLFDIVIEVTRLVDFSHQLGVIAICERQQSSFKATNFCQLNVVQIAAFRCEKHQTLLRNRHRRILFLLQQLGHFLTVAQLFTGCIVQIRCKLGEGRQFTILRQRGTNTTGQFLDDLSLSSTTHTGYRDTRVNSRTDTGVEQVRFQEDLTISNRDYVGRNERRNVTRLSFDDWQRGQRTGLAFHFTIGEALNVVSAHA
ncbi:hypothetical protein PAJ_3190 [Pantoea ananatis AJ13355]|uniref:Uncharacterized protein n=1 Tax=Pantoea ananatis (strain AJ13355) TaxID=932677 RepID=A0A0H3L8Q5_PANAA|nr:hypothetical protein PAJ_3190 [Pantoea ananatis AJ13355]